MLDCMGEMNAVANQVCIDHVEMEDRFGSIVMMFSFLKLAV